MLVVRVALSPGAPHGTCSTCAGGERRPMQAINRRSQLGVRLPTYATRWSALHAKFLLDNVRQVRVGTTNARRRLLHNLREEKRRLEEQGFEVGPKLLAERFGVSEEDVRDVGNALAAHDVALDAPVGDEDGRSRADVFPSGAPDVEQEVARRELQERTEAALARFRADLGERERAILDERILADEPLTLQAIGDRFGTTREAARQAEARLMARLKTFLQAELGDLASIRIGPD
jgi:RNA polymerase sigma-32 factor